MQLCNFEDFSHLSYIVGKSSELIMRIATIEAVDPREGPAAAAGLT
jgi:hypothetical protein